LYRYKTVQTMSLFERVSRFNSRQQLGATELDGARVDIERRKGELAAMRTNLAEAVALWPQRLAQRREALEALQAEESAVPADETLRKLELRTKILAAVGLYKLSSKLSSVDPYFLKPPCFNPCTCEVKTRFPAFAFSNSQLVPLRVGGADGDRVAGGAGPRHQRGGVRHRRGGDAPRGGAPVQAA
jgi:hypothetical protein